MIVQQAFIKLTNSQNKQEMILVAQPTGKQYSLHIVWKNLFIFIKIIIFY